MGRIKLKCCKIDVSMFCFIGFFIKFSVFKDIIFFCIIGWILLDIMIINVFSWWCFILFNILMLLRIGMVRFSKIKFIVWWVNIFNVFILFDIL